MNFDFTENMSKDLTVSLRSDWSLSLLATQCICGAHYHALHALSCKKDSFITLRNNHIRYVTA